MPSCEFLNQKNNRHAPLLKKELKQTDEIISDQEIQIIQLQKRNSELQSLVTQLKTEVNAYRASMSWRITKPIRKISLLYYKYNRLINFFKQHKYAYLDIKGYIRLLYQLANTLLTGGGYKIWRSVVLNEKLMLATSLLNRTFFFEANNAYAISWLTKFQSDNLVINPTIILDHNSGGGTNTYTKTLIKQIITEKGSTLRIYPDDNIWFAEWIGKYNQMLFKTLHIEELFTVLSLSKSDNIIINSLYGHPDLNLSSSHIIKLRRYLNAKLDIKINDFNALCPSPHLLNSEGRYCGVPKNVQTCRKCLLQNQDWYHSWYPEENKTIDILQWRTPFNALFNEASTITFFDPSSIEIMQKAVHIEETKIKLTPHTTDYFHCEQEINLNKPLHIGTLGALSQLKGSNVIAELYEYIKTHDMDIPITIIGPNSIGAHSDIAVHGSYEPNELPYIIIKKGINVILMASIIPETFSYTLSEAIKMKLPVVAFDIGAQGNRVKQYKFGKAIPLSSCPQEILAAIQNALQSAQNKVN